MIFCYIFIGIKFENIPEAVSKGSPHVLKCIKTVSFRGLCPWTPARGFALDPTRCRLRPGALRRALRRAPSTHPFKHFTHYARYPLHVLLNMDHLLSVDGGGNFLTSSTFDCTPGYVPES